MFLNGVSFFCLNYMLFSKVSCVLLGFLVEFVGFLRIFKGFWMFSGEVTQTESKNLFPQWLSDLNLFCDCFAY